MRAMILAAGQGKRLRPITATIPKPMVKAGGKTLLEHHFDKLKAIGITDVVVNGAYLKDVLFDYLGDGSSFGLNIKLSGEDADGLETAGGIIKALPLLGNDPFLVVNGDIFLDTDYDFLLPCPKQLQSTPPVCSTAKPEEPERLAHLYLTNNPAHNAKGDFALSDTGDLIYGSDYTFAGFAWYHQLAFKGREVCREPLRPYFDRWVAQKKITASVLSAKWFDVGTVERLNDLNTYLESKQAK